MSRPSTGTRACPPLSPRRMRRRRRLCATRCRRPHAAMPRAGAAVSAGAAGGGAPVRRSSRCREISSRPRAPIGDAARRRVFGVMIDGARQSRVLNTADHYARRRSPPGRLTGRALARGSLVLRSSCSVQLPSRGTPAVSADACRERAAARRNPVPNPATACRRSLPPETARRPASLRMQIELREETRTDSLRYDGASLERRREVAAAHWQRQSALPQRPRSRSPRAGSGARPPSASRRCRRLSPARCCRRSRCGAARRCAAGSARASP